MTTRIELTRALQAKGISFAASDDHDPNGPSEYIAWPKMYNKVAWFASDAMPIDADLLMGWHYDDTYLHISTVGAEFIITSISRYTTEQAAECVARFIAGTYLMAGMTK
jgi:hypothetical protein